MICILISLDCQGTFWFLCKHRNSKNMLIAAYQIWALANLSILKLLACNIVSKQLVVKDDPRHGLNLLKFSHFVPEKLTDQQAKHKHTCKTDVTLTFYSLMSLLPSFLLWEVAHSRAWGWGDFQRETLKSLSVYVLHIDPISSPPCAIKTKCLLT